MADAPCMLGHPEEEFVILNAIKRRVEAAGRSGHGGPDAQDMADIHDAEQELG